MPAVREDHSSHLTPEQIVDYYRRAYRMVYNREPQVAHAIAEWYQANGEFVHRITLFAEITRLRDQAQKERLKQADRGVIQRLIARLKGGG
jgi:hypothetical protein